jgi:hypothetical protein
MRRDCLDLFTAQLKTMKSKFGFVKMLTTSNSRNYLLKSNGKLAFAVTFILSNDG